MASASSQPAAKEMPSGGVGDTLRKMSTLELGITILILFSALLVYVSLFMESAILFVAGELSCLLLAPFIMWFERAKIRQWWRDRHKRRWQ